MEGHLRRSPIHVFRTFPALPRCCDGQRKKRLLRKKGCSLSKDWNPEVIGSTATLPVAVKTSLWNCMAGNTANLLHVIGQYTDDIRQAMKLLQTNFSPSCSRTKFKALKELMRKFHYHIHNTPKKWILLLYQR